MLSEDAIKKFKEIYRKEYGKEISDDKAMELGINLLTLMRHIYRPIKQEQLENK